MIVCYQWWFTPKENIYHEFGDRSFSLHSKRPPEEAGEYHWGIYHEVMVVWKIKK